MTLLAGYRTACHGREKLSALRVVGEPITFRAKELEQRPQAVRDARTAIQHIREATSDWGTSRPWVDANETAALLKQVCMITNVHRKLLLLEVGVA